MLLFLCTVGYLYTGAPSASLPHKIALSILPRLTARHLASVLRNGGPYTNANSFYAPGIGTSSSTIFSNTTRHFHEYTQASVFCATRVVNVPWQDACWKWDTDFFVEMGHAP